MSKLYKIYTKNEAGEWRLSSVNKHHVQPQMENEQLITITMTHSKWVVTIAGLQSYASYLNTAAETQIISQSTRETWFEHAAQYNELALAFLKLLL